MRRFMIGACLFALPLLFAWSSPPQDEAEKFWPQWRGPLASGIATHGNPPIDWSEQKNIRWKVNIPGRGSSSPIVWGNMIFVTSAVPVDESGSNQPQANARQNRRSRSVESDQPLKFTLFAINRQDGSMLWQQVARVQKPHDSTHPTGTWASNSPITDGERVYAYYGSYGLYCYDLKGKLLWDIDLGDMRTRGSFGEGSSPSLVDDKIIVNWDHEEQSFIVALDKKTGKELWREQRDEVTSWSTPLIVRYAGKTQVIVNATGKTRSYNPDNGEVIWECDGMTLNTIPSPVFENGVVYITSGFRGNKLQAIDLSKARGDISGTDAVLWEHDRDTPYVPSPLLYGNNLYFLKNNNGILSNFDVRTGKPNYTQQRLDGIQGVYASPVAAQDRVYLTGRNGVVNVIRNSSTFELLATNQLDDNFDASPAIVGNEMFLRGQNLYCIAEK